MTLEDMLRDQPDSPEYTARRAETVAAIADWIRGYLREPDAAPEIAAQLMERAENRGDVVGDEVHLEVPAHLTTSGRPIVFTI